MIFYDKQVTCPEPVESFHISNQWRIMFDVEEYRKMLRQINMVNQPWNKFNFENQEPQPENGGLVLQSFGEWANSTNLCH